MMLLDGVKQTPVHCFHRAKHTDVRVGNLELLTIDYVEEVEAQSESSPSNSSNFDADIYVGKNGICKSEILLPGTVLFCGDLGFRVVNHINDGGMSNIYEVTAGKERYAAKVLRKDLLTTLLIERFGREVKLMKKCKGKQGIIPFIASGKNGEQPFFIMEFADGGSLQEAIDKKTLSTKEILNVLAFICTVLEQLHKEEIIHRDLKPSNFLFVNGEPKLSDFGISASHDYCEIQSSGSSFDDMSSYKRLTETNGIIGTPFYMSPEQAKSALAPGEEIQKTADYYSMAVVAYEVLTGSFPIEYSGEGKKAYLERVVNVQPVSIFEHKPEIPTNLGNAIMLSLNKNPEHRTVSLSRLGREMKEYADTL